MFLCTLNFNVKLNCSLGISAIWEESEKEHAVPCIDVNKCQIWLTDWLSYKMQWTRWVYSDLKRWELKLGKVFFLRNQKQIIYFILNVKFFIRILCCKNPNFLTYALGILLLTQCASYQLNFCSGRTQMLYKAHVLYCALFSRSCFFFLWKLLKSAFLCFIFWKMCFIFVSYLSGWNIYFKFLFITLK